MGLFNSIRLGSSGAGDYEIERSLKFHDDDSAYLIRTNSSAGNRRTYTISVWAKIIDNGTYRAIIGAGGGVTRDRLQIFDDDKIVFNLNDGGDAYLRTNRQVRDPSAWYHIVVGVDTTQGTASNRIKLYVNGVQETSFTNETYPSQNYESRLNDNNDTYIGNSSANNLYFDGYLAEINFIDGSQLTPSSFGETNSKTGQWVPKKYSGSYGTNGYFLNFSDNSGTTATTLGKDSSGNGNNFTPNNFSVAAGSGNDSLEDSPTNNWCTLNPLDQKNSTISNGNLTITQASDPCRTRGTFSMRPDTGKWYYEMTVGSGSSYLFGMKSISSKIDDNTENVNYYGANGNKSVNNSSSSYGASYSAGDTVAILYDSDNHTVNFYKNNADQGQITGISATTEYLPHVYLDNYGTAPVVHFNFGQRAFAYTPPTGAKKLCSANIPDPSIAKPNKHFDILTWTGNNTDNRAITGLNFQPDFTWIKRRSGGGMSHFVVDALRSYTDSSGNGNVGPLATNDTYAESNALTDGGFESFNSDGFTLGKGSSTANAAAPYQRNNASSETYVGWNWKGGGSASSNGNGSITSSVSANTTAGFSIATYSGNSTAGATVGHGLGVKPDCIIIKTRNASDNWMVYHAKMDGSSPEDYKMELNDAGARVDSSNMLNDTAPTSSVVTLSADGSVNSSSRTYVMYCFSGVAGYSKFGSYIGNNNADGTFVHLGFRPAWLMIKNREAGSTAWYILDNKRDPDNPAQQYLDADGNGAEGTYIFYDFLSNGFKLRNTGSAQNPNGQALIYLAFAESPFKYSRAR